jgi:hypothetical protein
MLVTIDPLVLLLEITGKKNVGRPVKINLVTFLVGIFQWTEG